MIPELETDFALRIAAFVFSFTSFALFIMTEPASRLMRCIRRLELTGTTGGVEGTSSCFNTFKLAKDEMAFFPRVRYSRSHPARLVGARTTIHTNRFAYR